MEFFKPGMQFDFMRRRRLWVGISAVLCLLSVIGIFYPGPNYGTDFMGGTEIQVGFNGVVTASELRTHLEEMGYESVDVVEVQGIADTEDQTEFMIRTRAFSAISAADETRIDTAIRGAVAGLDGDVTVLPGDNGITIPEGGDTVRITLSGDVDPGLIESAIRGAGVGVVRVVAFGTTSDHVLEAQLEGVAQEMLDGLRSPERLGERGPLQPDRIQRVGPRAGAQLRNAAIQSLLYTIGFIMLYVAFRFDLRYAPGAVVALMHDAIITVGVFILLQKELNLTIVAALLTIVGYSINDTIVVYDRIRENISRHRGKSLYDVINISQSEMLSRTIITSGVTLLSVSAFFVFGTAVIRDISFALFVGFIAGVYSSIYIAAPMTEYLDTRFFARARDKARAGRARAAKRKEA